MLARRNRTLSSHPTTAGVASGTATSSAGRCHPRSSLADMHDEWTAVTVDYLHELYATIAEQRDELEAARAVLAYLGHDWNRFRRPELDELPASDDDVDVDGVLHRARRARRRRS